MKKIFDVELEETVRYLAKIEAETLEEAFKCAKRLTLMADFPTDDSDVILQKIAAEDPESGRKLETVWDE